MSQPRRPSGSAARVKGPWDVETKRLASDLIVTTMRGVANGAFAEEVHAQLREELAKLGGRPVDWIPDASGIEKTEASIYGPAKGVLKDFKDLGGRHVVAVITSAPVRMAAQTISFGSKLIGGAVIEIVSSMDEARRYLEDERRKRIESGNG